MYRHSSLRTRPDARRRVAPLVIVSLLALPLGCSSTEESDKEKRRIVSQNAPVVRPLLPYTPPQSSTPPPANTPATDAPGTSPSQAERHPPSSTEATDPARSEGDSPQMQEERQPVENAVRAYYAAINDRDVEAAYDLFSSEKQRELPRERYDKRHFRSITHAELSRCELTHIRGDSAEVLIQVTTKESSDAASETWTGPLLLVKEGGQWKIRSMSKLRRQ